MQGPRARMADPVIETRTPEQLGRATAISPDALVTIQEEGGPVVSIAVKALLGRLVQTDTAKETRADLLADLDHDPFAVALVYADPDAAKNGWYRKSGVSGDGTWVQFEKLSAQAAAEIEPLVEAAAESAAASQSALDAAAAFANFIPGGLAAGEAATVNGELFSVEHPAGTISLRQRTLGGSTEISTTPTSANLDAVLGTKAPASTKSTAAAATPYPVDFRLGRDHPPHPFEFVPANQHAAIKAGTSNYDAAPDLQDMLDGWTPDLVGGGAGVELFPSGRFALGSRLLFPRWIGWKGGGRGTQFLILPGHTGPYAFQFDSDPGKVLNGPAPDLPPAMFNQRLEGFDINCNGVALTSIIYAPSWNEKSGLRDVMARNCARQFLRVDEWHGGSAGFGIDDLEVFFTEAAHDANVTGISLAGITRANTAILNRPQVTIRNMTLIGGKIGGDIVDGENGFNAIEIDNAKVQLNGGIHFERCRTGISVKRNATVTGFGVTGSDANGKVVNLFERAANHTGFIRVEAIDKGTGGVRVLRDNKTGITLTDPVSDGVSVPSRPGEPWAECYITFAGTVPTIVSKQGPIASVAYAGAAGYHQVDFADSLQNVVNYEVEVDVFDDTDCRGRVRPGDKAAGNFKFRMQRESDDSGFNASAAWVRVYRKPGL